MTGSSPLSRGIRVAAQVSMASTGIIPALAGNTCKARCGFPCRRDHPRSRGEYNEFDFRNPPPAGSSPLSRGIRSSPAPHHVTSRIIPALAGNTCYRHTAQLLSKDHPRSRGEYVRWDCRFTNVEGSSPLSRGILVENIIPTLKHGIIPALAGNTGREHYPHSQTWDHPRSRGEYVSGQIGGDAFSGSSPLSRGILQPRNSILHSLGIIPALAGNTGPPRDNGRQHRDHPRSRGEYLDHYSPSLQTHGSSPLSRGILSASPLRFSAYRIIPALAGNTSRASALLRKMTDHPRSRGEYDVLAAASAIPGGSSPLSRGIRGGGW